MGASTFAIAIDLLLVSVLGSEQGDLFIAAACAVALEARRR